MADLCRNVTLLSRILRSPLSSQQLDRPPAQNALKAEASSLYLFSYYLGSSIAGTLGGVFWHNYGWNGVGAFIALMLVIALLVGTRLHRRLHA